MENCVFGNHLKYWDPYIKKMPEWVVFCIDCAERLEDDNNYTGDEYWIWWTRWKQIKETVWID